MSINIKQNLDALKNDPIYETLTTMCQPNTKLYLVGGFVRDFLLGKSSPDKDFVVNGENACEFAKKVADAVDGHYVELDPKYDIARVVMPDKINYMDFAACIGEEIFDDLKRRDFTINAIAYRIDGAESGLIDTLGGINDLKKGIVKISSEQNIIDDPLRILRAFRFSAQLGFSIDPKTLDVINKHINSINNVAFERINAELIKLFESDNAAQSIEVMKNNGLLFEIFPELQLQTKVPPNLHHHLQLIDHSIESVRQVESRFATLPEWVKDRLNSEFTTGTKVKSLMKMAVLLHDLGKPATWQIDEAGRHRFIKHDDVGAELAVPLLKRLKFSKNAIKYMTKLIKYHIYPSQLLRTEDPLAEKTILRMFRKIGEDVPDVIVLAMADRLSARGVEITDEKVQQNLDGLNNFLQKYKEVQENIEPLPKLLSGQEVMQILKIPQGPEIGKVLKALNEAQISGDINTKEEAVAFIKGFAQ